MMQFSEFAARRSSKAVKPPSLVEPTMVASLKGTAVSIDFFLPLLSHSSTLKLQLHFHCDIALFWGVFYKIYNHKEATVGSALRRESTGTPSLLIDVP